MHRIKLYFEDNLKLANTEISCNRGKSAKNPTYIFGFFYVTAYSNISLQLPTIVKNETNDFIHFLPQFGDNVL